MLVQLSGIMVLHQYMQDILHKIPIYPKIFCCYHYFNCYDYNYYYYYHYHLYYYYYYYYLLIALLLG